MQPNSAQCVENPLIWPLLTLLRAAQQSSKVHNLASELQQDGLLPDLDDDANKALFKRNFLLMNALYQLQGILLPEQWLQVQPTDIQIFTQLPTDLPLVLEQEAALRCYYLDWTHFDTSADCIEAMFTQFWNRYDTYIGKAVQQIDKNQALQIFELDNNASKQDIRRQWRKLALKWHPDRPSGHADKFRQVCEAWQTLRAGQAHYKCD
jgi:hypothetical protein